MILLERTCKGVSLDKNDCTTRMLGIGIIPWARGFGGGTSPPPPHTHSTTKAHQNLGLGWTGPYFVVGRGGETLVQIQRDREFSPLWVHQDDIKPYKAPELTEPWV